MTGSRRLTALMAAAVLSVTVAGCGDGATTRPVPAGSGPDSGSATSGQGPEPADAEQVLNGAGLGLPTGATDVTVTPAPKEPFTDRYLVTFTAPASAARELCRTAGLGGMLGMNPPLTVESRELLEMSQAPAGSEGCVGSNPDDLASQRTIVFTGDPAKVWVGVWRMPAR